MKTLFAAAALLFPLVAQAETLEKEIDRQTYDINVALHPDSMRTYDTLGTAYLQAGDRAQAVEAFLAGLAAMSRDRETPPSTIERLRLNAERQLRNLRGQ